MQKWLFLCMLMPVLFSCNWMGERVEGNGQQANENRQVSSFNSVEASGPMDIILQDAPNAGVRVEADQNLLPYILTDVDGKTLHIRTKKGYNLHSDNPMRVYVAAPVFNEVVLDGSGNITSQGMLVNPDDMTLKLSGSGNIDMQVNTPELKSLMNGSGNIKLSGSADKWVAGLSGSGNIYCFGLNTQKAEVGINGSGDAEVMASKQLTLKINGSGHIKYRGNANVDSHINGSGSVTKVE
jgi:hypothetical protein